MNQICVTTKPSRDGKKTWYYFEWGKAADQRRAAGIFTYTPAKNQTQRSHNKEAETILEIKKSQLTIDYQAIGTGYIPSHRFKHNFLDFYQDFVLNNARAGNRHLQASLGKFRAFVKRDRVAPIEISENLCNLFRAHLQDTLTGKTPLDYFNAFKRVVRSAAKEGYFRESPAADLHASTNASRRLKDFLEADELVALIDTPNHNEEAAMRWQPEGRIFELGTQNGCNKNLGNWGRQAGQSRDMEDLALKDLTWHSARLTFSILLQDAGVDPATVALLLGHTTTKYVLETYKRHRPKNQLATIVKLPKAHWETA